MSVTGINGRGQGWTRNFTHPQRAAPQNAPIFLLGSAGFAGATSQTVFVGRPVPQGGTVIVNVGTGGGTVVTSITDTQNNQYFKVQSDTNASNNTAAQWMAINCHPLSNQGDAITVNLSASATENVFAVGTLGSWVIDQAADATGASGSPTVTTASVNAPELCVAVAISGNAGGVPTWAANWVPLGYLTEGGGAYTSVALLDTSAAGTVTASTTTASTNWSIAVLTLQPTNFGPPVYPLHGPVRSQIPAAMPARAQVIGVKHNGNRNQLGPPITLLPQRTVQAFPAKPQLYGRSIRRAGVYNQLGPPVTPLRGPPPIKPATFSKGRVYRTNPPQTIAVLLGASGTFTGATIPTHAVSGWGAGAGEEFFYATPGTDGQIILGTLSFMQNELDPTADHAEVDVYDPSRDTFYTFTIPTSNGTTTTLKPGWHVGGTDVGAGDMTMIIRPDGTQRMMYTSDGYYFGWQISVNGLYPAIGYLQKSGSNWAFDSASSLTGNQLEATQPTLYSVIESAQSTNSFSESYWSVRGINQICVTPSGHAIVGHYFPGNGFNSGVLTAWDPLGNLVAAYQIPSMNAQNGSTSIQMCPRELKADPSSTPGDERFIVIYDSFANGGAAPSPSHTIQEFSFSGAAITPMSVPCISTATDSLPQAAFFDYAGNLWLGQASVTGGSGLQARAFAIYLKKSGNRNFVTSAPATGSWATNGSYATAVAADYYLGFAQAQALGVAAPLGFDISHDIAYVPGWSGFLGTVYATTLPIANNLGSNLLSTADSTFSSFTGDWTGFVTNVSQNTTLGDGDSDSMNIVAPFSQATVVALGPKLSVTAGQEYYASAALISTAGNPACTGSVGINWYDGGGTQIGSTSTGTIINTLSTSSWLISAGACPAPVNAATGQVVITIATVSGNMAANTTFNADNVFLQSQPFATVPTVDLGAVGLRAGGATGGVLPWRPGLTSKRFLYVPLPQAFSAAQQSAYGSSYVPAAMAQWLTQVNTALVVQQPPVTITLSITTTSLPNAVMGELYGPLLLASGGTLPYTWSISSGSLPSWASLNASTGIISGMPNVLGSTSFTVKVTDINGNTATQALSINVSAAFFPITHPARTTYPVQFPKLFGRAGGIQHSGVFDQLGPPVTPLRRPVKPQLPVPFLHGRAIGIVKAGPPIPTNPGPPVYPLQGPVGNAHRAPGPFLHGRAYSNKGVYNQVGPPVTPLKGPVRARQPLPPPGRVYKRPGAFSQLGPPVYPLRQPVNARLPGPFLHGRSQSLTGFFGGLGPPVKPLSGPVRSRLPGPFLHGRAIGISAGTRKQTGPSVYPLHQPVKAKLPIPFLKGRSRGTIAFTFTPTNPPVKFPLYLRQPGWHPRWAAKLSLSRGRRWDPEFTHNQGHTTTFQMRKAGPNPRYYARLLPSNRRHFDFPFGQGNQGQSFPRFYKTRVRYQFKLRRGQFFMQDWGQANKGPLVGSVIQQNTAHRRLGARLLPSRRREFWITLPQSSQGSAFATGPRQRQRVELKLMPSRRRRFDFPMGQGNQGRAYPSFTQQAPEHRRWAARLMPSRRRWNDPGWGQASQGQSFPRFYRQPARRVVRMPSRRTWMMPVNKGRALPQVYRQRQRWVLRRPRPGAWWPSHGHISTGVRLLWNDLFHKSTGTKLLWNDLTHVSVGINLQWNTYKPIQTSPLLMTQNQTGWGVNNIRLAQQPETGWGVNNTPLAQEGEIGYMGGGQPE